MQKEMPLVLLYVQLCCQQTGALRPLGHVRLTALQLLQGQPHV